MRAILSRALQQNFGVKWPRSCQVKALHLRDRWLARDQRWASLQHPTSDRPVISADLLQRITIRPDQCGGRPCIRGMRIRVIDVLELLVAGESREQILEEFPYLEPEDIAASLLYAARRMNHPTVAA